MTIQDSTTIAFDKQAWEFFAHKELRDQLLWDEFAHVTPQSRSSKGSVIKFTFVADFDPATTALDEVTDVEPVATTDTNVTLTVAEYGNAYKTSKWIRANSFIPLDPILAEKLGRNAGESLDILARNAYHSGTTIVFGGDATDEDEVVPGDELTAALVRRQHATLKTANVQPFSGGKYAFVVHPHVSVDLREETGADKWRDPMTYGQDQSRIWNGEIGTFEGFRFVESNRAVIEAAAGAGTTPADVYNNIAMGREAVAKGFDGEIGPKPVIVSSPVVDSLNRFKGMGWYWIGGYVVFREECLINVKVGSSLDTGYVA